MNRQRRQTGRWLALLGLPLVVLSIIAAANLTGDTGMTDNNEVKELIAAKSITPALEERLAEGTAREATFAAGCFWGVEDRFMAMDGVLGTAVGYTGGHVDNPTYRQVCYENTGHAEAVRIIYNPEQIRYQELVEAFFSLHNPTTMNRQGPDVGSQYRSAIFYYDEDQRATAEKVIKSLTEQNAFSRPIVTQLEEADVFWTAEDYHQKYNLKNGRSCMIN